MKPFVSKDFKIPQGFETDKFRVRMLTINDVVKDYDAVMSSEEHLIGTFRYNSAWPKNLTFEQNLIDLGWHNKEFQRRDSFAYGVFTLDEQKELGCVYFYPDKEGEYDAIVYMWVRKSEFDKGLDPVLETAVKDWISKEWQFENIKYPNR